MKYQKVSEHYIAIRRKYETEMFITRDEDLSFMLYCSSDLRLPTHIHFFIVMKITMNFTLRKDSRIKHTKKIHLFEE